MKKKSGFTMIELLVTIVIIGILSTIGIATITNLRKNQEIKHDQTQVEIFRQTAKTYFTDNKSRLPYKPMGTKKVTLQQLIDENYIDSLLKYNKEPYDNSSYVTVRLLGNGIYGYTVSLKKDDTNIDDVDQKPTTIEYKFNDFAKDYDDDSKIHYINNVTTNAKVNIKIEDQHGIAAYKYTITGTKTKKESEYIYVNKQTTVTDSISINKNDYEDGKYKISITVWDVEGYEKKYSGGGNIVYLDTKNPKCSVNAYTKNEETSKYDILYTSGKWTNKDVMIITTCDDPGGSGCTSGGDSNLLTTTTNSSNKKITFYDKAGNQNTCNTVINIKIDKNEPTCTVTGGNATWINKSSITTSREITAICSDTGGSGCTKTSFSKTYSENINTTTAGAIDNNSGGKVYDNAGNEGVCPANQTVKIDKNEPTCTVTGGNATWINKSSTTTSRKITATCSDTGGSGCTKTSFSKTYSDNINTTTAGAIDNNSGGSISDNAGNVVNCPANQTVKIDIEKPTCGTFSASGTEGNNGWYISDINLSVGCNDAGGSKCETTSFTKKITAEGNKNRSITIKDNAGNTTSCTKRYKIDKTDPKCGTLSASGTEGNNGWYISDINLSIECDDDISGCTKTTYTGSISTEGTSSSTSITIKDKAGRTKSCYSGDYKIDKTPPTVVCEYKGDASNQPLCTAESLKYYYKCKYTEEHSGIDSAVFEWGGKKELESVAKDYSRRNEPISIPTETLCMIGNQETHVTYSKLCDAAGHCMTGLPLTWKP